MKRVFVAIAALLLLAANPGEVVPELEADGFYIESGSDASPGVIGNAVAEAGFAGGRLYIVVLSEEPVSGATFFAEVVLDDLGSGTVLTVAPETVGYASDGQTWTAAELDGAVDASLGGASDDDVAVRFVESLTGNTLDEGVDSGAGGGEPDSGGSGAIWFLVFLGGMIALFVYLRNRSQKTATSARAARLAEFREAAQEKLDAVANDILEMEDEVSMADNPEVLQHYKSASAKYADVIDKITTATDPEALLELTNQLDIAIWELDVAEAYLDDKPPPKKPEPTRFEPAQPKEGAGPGPIISSPTQPQYDRRPQRQSSPAGPDLGSILLALLAARGMGGGNYSGRWTGGPRPGSGGGISGGGSRRFGGGGGRIRGGGRRGG